MMALVALVALGFGATFELKDHIERDRLLRGRADRYRETATHLMRVLECTVAADRQDPYRPAERARELSGDRVRTFLPPGGFPSWQAELEDHRYWGVRIYGEAVSCDERLEAVEARLLLPALKWTPNTGPLDRGIFVKALPHFNRR
jgi:hypothetical protein